jgi:predicted Zn-dependent protease
VADETDDPALAGSVVGYASVLRASWTTTDARIERAEVVLRDDYVVSAEQSTAPGFTVDELLLHELGHAVGLAHSSDTTEVMYPELGHQPRTGYQSGDQNGLARVGAGGGCLT